LDLEFLCGQLSAALFLFLGHRFTKRIFPRIKNDRFWVKLTAKYAKNAKQVEFGFEASALQWG
jgi:hypothetical protein